MAYVAAPLLLKMLKIGFLTCTHTQNTRTHTHLSAPLERVWNWLIGNHDAASAKAQTGPC